MPENITPFVRDGERWLAPLGGLVAEVIGGELRIYQQNGTGVGHFPLAPRVQGGATTLQEWHMEQGALIASLVENPGISVRVWSAGGRVHYRLYCPLTDPLDITCFPGATFRGPQWHTFVADELDRAWSKDTAQAVSVSTAVDIDADTARGVPWRWLMTPPPRACAFQYDDGWLALTAPRALPVAATTFAVDGNEQFSLAFSHYRAQNAGGHGPEVVFIGGLTDPYQALDELAVLERELGETHGPVEAYPWWLRPLFCTWGEQVQWGAEAGTPEEAITAQNVRTWVTTLRERLGTADFNVIIDYKWFRAAGDFSPNLALFGNDKGMRALIDELHAAGHKVLLWLTPYSLDRSARVVNVNEPNGLVMADDDTPATLRCAPLVRDFTYAPMHEQFRGAVKHLLAPNGLNADGLKLDYLYNCPDPRTTKASDPSWGSGDELWAKILVLVAEAARDVKPDAFISISSAMPYVQPHIGAVRLNDNFSQSAMPWWKRARVVTRTLPGTLIDTDGWPLYHADASAHWMTAPVYGIPALYHVTHLDNREPMTDEDYRRIAASWLVYANAPVWTDQRIVVDPERGLFERYYPDGSLAAECHGNAVLVTLSPTEVRVCGCEARRIELPIGDNRQVTDIHLASITGESKPLHFDDLSQRPLTINVPDAGVSGQYLRIFLAT